MLVARDEAGVALSCGALRHLGDDVVELRRMYVVPEAHRRGVEGGAGRARGCRDCPRLDDPAPGDRPTPARRLDEGAGYRPIAAFGAYIDADDAEESLCYERVLRGG